MLLLVPVHPGRPGQRAVKWSCVCTVVTGVVPGYRRGDQFDAHEFLLCLLTQIEHDSRFVDCSFTYHC